MNLAEYFKKQIFYNDIEITEKYGIMIFEETTKTLYTLEEFISDKIKNNIVNFSNYEIIDKTINNGFIQLNIK